MAYINLRHPLHGEKIAHGELEASMDRANGWEDWTPPVPVPNDVPSFLQPSGKSDLPPDFPGREALIAGGLVTWMSVMGKTSEELQELNGIGAATARNILKVMDS